MDKEIVTIMSLGVSGCENIKVEQNYHAFTGGVISDASGGSFWSGAAAGGISSLTGSLIGSEKLGLSGTDLDVAQWVGGGLTGGAGSLLAGGTFFEGARQGLITGGLNHAAHEIVNIIQGPIHPPIDPITKKPYLPGFKDAKLFAKSKSGRIAWKLPDGKILEWTSKNGVVEMYSRNGKKWLGKYNPHSGKAISTTTKLGRVASIVKSGVRKFFTELSLPVYVGPGSGFEDY